MLVSRSPERWQRNNEGQAAIALRDAGRLWQWCGRLDFQLGSPLQPVNVLRLIRRQRCFFLFVAHNVGSDRLILAPEAVVTTAAAQSCVDRESLKCQRNHNAGGQGNAREKVIIFLVPEQQRPLYWQRRRG